MDNDIEIMPWKVRTNDFYSRVAMRQKNRTSERSERVSLFKHFLWCNVFTPYILRFFLTGRISKIGSHLKGQCHVMAYAVFFTRSNFNRRYFFFFFLLFLFKSRLNTALERH